ncbi:hypothetical protein Mzhil_0125 [Methanosalsum zhilinae DSM 4017]|uniref:Uncharacterized protein n=1 Tax=Methanosalsum zhilinae (strain DSM 4017 / NBRC 107636 / OCM 62 / WeN5) TaxID=679901 RepID=F7XMY4_METZD|nr:hypothetical protein [Methanosalsum zhilinae]AEH60005.1 hypothetical protein Mzhil_0125 [Methanosalsum zhilinae DSM 4017]
MERKVKVVSDGISFTIWVDNGLYLKNVPQIAVVQGTALPKDSSEQTITTINYGGYDPEDFMRVIEGPYSYSYLESPHMDDGMYGDVMYYYPTK